MFCVSDVTLLVIDMQSGFPASWNVLDEVIHEMEIASGEGASCIIMEYENCGSTLAGIKLAAQKHKLNCRNAKKNSSCGAKEVALTCKGNGFGTRVFRVVGVNLHGCVEATVLGLIELFPSSTIEVVMDGCSDNYGVDWTRFPVHPNIKLIYRSQFLHASSGLSLDAA